MDLSGLLEEPELTELVDANIPRVDLVGKGANGIPRFLLAKSADDPGLLDPEFVRDLIAKAEPETRERATLPNGITVSGSPADIAAFIHKAAQRAGTGDVAKAEQSTKSQNDLPDSAFAYIEPGGKKDAGGKTTPRSLRHFPINDAAHVRNALARASQSPFGDKAMPRIRAAAKKFGIDVSKEAGVTAAVTKDMGPDLDDGIDRLDPTVPLCAPEDDDAPGDPTDPGSPAWEAIDAATACKWASILSRARVACDLLAQREMLEAASGDPDDAGNACDLQDACCAIDFCIGILAPYAVAEQSEADCGEDMAMVGKAAADPEALAAIAKAADGLAGPVFVLESLGAVIRKSGRVLSAANEAHIREAAQRLTTVLSSLPKAPVTDDGQMVAKEKEGAAMADTDTKPAAEVAKAESDEQARDTGPVSAGGTTGLGEPRATGPAGSLPSDGPQAALPGDVPGRQVIKTTPAVGVFGHGRQFLGLADPAAILTDIAKADGEGKKAMCVVYNQDGALIGIVDPDDITPVSNSEAAPDEAPAEDAPAEAAPAADPGDMTPAPAATVGTPADDVAKAETKPATQDAGDTRTVLKGIVAEALADYLGAQDPAEGVAKSADVAAVLQRLNEVSERVAAVEKQDARPGVFANGAMPPAGAVPPARPSLRGQDQGAQPVDVAKAAELKQRISSGAATAPEQNQAWNELMSMSLAKFAEIRGDS